MNGTLGKGRLSAQLRERIAVAVAGSKGCEYCLAAHTAIGSLVGLDAAELARNRSGDSSEPKAAAALRFARTINESRGHVDDAELEAVRAAGFDDGEIAEIVANVAIKVFTNYFNSVARMEIDFPHVAGKAAA